MKIKSNVLIHITVLATIAGTTIGAHGPMRSLFALPKDDEDRLWLLGDFDDETIKIRGTVYLRQVNDIDVEKDVHDLLESTLRTNKRIVK